MSKFAIRQKLGIKYLFLEGVQDKNSKKERVYWLDYTKGIGILLAVFGHVLRGLVTSSIVPSSPLVIFIDKWIYAFHMPLFFFISGLFVQRSLSKPLTNFIANKLGVIAYPYCLWSVLQAIFQWFASQYTNLPSSLTNLWKIIYEPVMQFWFLYTLFVTLVLYSILHKLKVSPGMFLIASVGLYGLYLGNVQIGTWGVFYLLRCYAIYFALGVIIGTSIFPTLDRIRTSILASIAIVGYLTVGLAVPFQPAETQLPVVQLAMLGIAATVALSILLNRFKMVTFVKTWGLLCLNIYVAHTIAASGFRILLQKTIGFSEPIAHILLGTLVGLYAPILLDVFCRRVGFKYMFTFNRST